MSHKDAGNYGAKHIQGPPADALLTRELKTLTKDGCISCTDAHAVSKDLGIPPAEIGKAIDGMEIKIIRCQLGLFGHEKGKRNIVAQAAEVDESLAALLGNTAFQNRISCKALWDIAQERNMQKMDLTSACEAMGIKIVSCQLGAF